MKKSKKYIPQFIKFPLWFLFKAPQRKIGLYTIWLDIKGITHYLIQTFNPTQELAPISICVGTKNRSKIFIRNFVRSLNNCKHPHLIELSVFDCDSNDVANFEELIRKEFQGKLIFKSENIPFSRAVAFNKAVLQSTNDLIFICDADFSIPKNIVSMVNKFTDSQQAWFPIVFYLYKNKPEFYSPKNGEWMIWGGKGILACQKKDFLKIGMIDETFIGWGGEDEELWQRFYQNKFVIIRNRCKELLHHWHPSENPKYKKLADLADSGLL
ncbi:MAG: galactosyltransferase-related protein [Bacteroidia bacterium]